MSVWRAWPSDRSIDPDLAYIFKHALTQETAYQSLLRKKRREIHRAVAQVYERLYADRLDEYAALLARHYAEAGDDARVLAYSIRAGDRAARVYASPEALEHYTRALDLAKARLEGAARSEAASAAIPPPPAEDFAQLLMHLYMGRGRAFEVTGLFDEALLNYEDMEALARRLGDRALELASLVARAGIRSTPNKAHDAGQAQARSSHCCSA